MALIPRSKPSPTVTEDLSVGVLRARLAIVPAWMEGIMHTAEKNGKLVRYTYASTPFGRYPVALEVSDLYYHTA